MNTKRIGNIGEAVVLAKLVEMGIPVYQQFGDNEAADYLIIINNKIKKIQVKTSESGDGEKTTFNLTSILFNKNEKRHKYSKEEIDYFICYDLVTKELFLIKNNGNMISITIRYNESKNNQKVGINYYKDYLLNYKSLCH